MAMRRCCIVMPAYGEASHLTTLIPSLFAQQSRVRGSELWVLVVDGDSPDGTAALIESQMDAHPRLRLLQGAKYGLGDAYQRGFAHARASLAPDLVVQMDADWQHDPAALPGLIEACSPPVEIAIGSRFIAGGRTPSYSRRRRITSLAGGWLLEHAAGLPPLHDYTSGFRCLRAELAWSLVERCRRDGLARRGYAFQSSLIAEALLSGTCIQEIPIVFGSRRHGRSKLRWRDYWEFAVNLRRLRRRARTQTRSAAAATAGG
jgi:dolichol-phosphate mannosyltransferase